MCAICKPTGSVVARVIPETMLHHEIDLVLGDVDGTGRVAHQVVGQRDHPIRIAHIGVRVAERAARRDAADAVDVAVGIGGRRGDKGDVDVQIAGLDRPGATTMRVHDGGPCERAPCDRPPTGPAI